MASRRRRPQPAGTDGGRNKQNETTEILAPGPRLLKLDEAAHYVALSPRTVWSLGASGELPVVRVGRSARFDRVDLDALIEHKKKGRR